LTKGENEYMLFIDFFTNLESVVLRGDSEFFLWRTWLCNGAQY